MKLQVDSLAFALAGAARALAAVEAGKALPRALSEVFAARTTSAATRGAVQDLAYRSMRRWGLAQALLRELAERPPTQPRLRALLGCALALLSEETPAYAPHTLVSQAVDACASDHELQRAKGMANAVLRRFLRERDSLLNKVRRQDEARWNYPAWWIDKARSAWPQQWQQILAAGDQAPPLTLRVNRRKTSLTDYLSMLAAQGIVATPLEASALKLVRALPVSQIPGFADGLASVQDGAAQLAAPLLDLHDGMRVLDACAAPGGKTGHLLELADINLLALDQDGERLVRVRENLQRLSLQAELRQGDASERDWWDGQPFDRILADVPCTASGIVRRHPDIRWLRRPDDSAQLAALSAHILDNLWGMLKPGGKLLLATCSLWPEESALQAQSLIERQGAIALPSPGQLLPTSTEQSDHDGLFYALLQKPEVCYYCVKSFPGVAPPLSRVIRRFLLGLSLTLLLACAPVLAQAAEGIEFNSASLEATDEGYKLSSNFSVELTRSLEDALMRGVPLYFVLQVEVSRPRWYWFDEVAIKAARKIRLSYNVLTQQYRASVDGSLHRNFSRLDEMLALLRRPGRWVVAEAGALQKDGSYTVAVQLSLDVSALPKPIQVSALGNGDWRMSSGWSRFTYEGR